MIITSTQTNTDTVAVQGVPSPGSMVQVRGRHYVVTDVRQSSLAPDPLKPTRRENGQHIVALSSVEDDAAGEELEVVWEIEPGAHYFERLSLPEPTGFDSPDRLDAFIDAVRWGAVSSADVKALQSPFRSGIEIEDYQLDPVVRALQMPRVNLLVADGVGLGKTIETGLVLQELVLRHRVRTALIICPASLCVQWRDQMRDKFGLEFRIVDADLMRDLRRRRGLHVNPWNHYPRLITSMDFIKRERPLRLFRELLPAPGESNYPRKFDLMIVDEAHNVAPSGAGRYATDSLRTAAIRELTPHFEHKLFLSATPHNGYSESFSALLELVDDQRFARGVDPDRAQLGAIMVRRLKDELSKKWDGSTRFAARRIEPIEVPYTDDEKRVHQLLTQYAKLRSASAASQSETFAIDFVLMLLKKRLFSSPAAFHSTLIVHKSSIETARKRSAPKPSLKVLKTQIEQIEEDRAIEEDTEAATEEAVDSAARLFSPLSSEEEKILSQLIAFAEKASGRGDTKSDGLIAWLHKNLKTSDGQWNDQRVLIFTEYRATQKWLQGILSSHGFAADGRLQLLYGGMDDEQREDVKAAFQAPPSKSPVRILLATDAASEGIDLQNHCHLLIHYEIPFSVTKLEQRAGRLDRHGQRAPEVLVHHFVGQGYNRDGADAIVKKPGELEGDLEFLARVVTKVERIREDLGKVGPVIAQQVQEAMLGRRKGLDTSQAEQDAKPVREMLRFERNLEKQIQALREKLDTSRKELKVTPENVRKIVDIGLQLANQQPLIPSELLDGTQVFRVPPLTGSWTGCLDGLQDRFTGELRPITFNHDVAAGRQDVVLAHLNHRLVQMCLRLLRAEVWSMAASKKLHRVTARIVPTTVTSVPAVVAYGRQVVLGGDNERLHEEIIMGGGFLKEGRFARFASLSEMNEILAAATDVEAPQSVRDKLTRLWSGHKEPLLSSLDARSRDRVASLESALADKAAKEKNDITAILKELETQIQEELSHFGKSYQLDMFNQDEQDQFKRNEQALRARLAAIPRELAEELKRIDKRFASPQPRLFPVAVVYLVPENIAREAAR